MTHFPTQTVRHRHPVSIRVVTLDPTILGATIGAGSALGGGLIAASLQYLTESRKLKKQETTRWDEQLLHLAVELLEHCDKLAPRNAFYGNNLELNRRKDIDLHTEVVAMKHIITRIEILGPTSLHRRASNLDFACFRFFQQPIDENRTGQDDVFWDVKDAYDSFVTELKSVLSARRSAPFSRKVPSLAEKRPPEPDQLVEANEP